MWELVYCDAMIAANRKRLLIRSRGWVSSDCLILRWIATLKMATSPMMVG